MKSLALASQQTTIAVNSFALDVYSTELDKRQHVLTVAKIRYTILWYSYIGKQLYIAGLFYIVALIHAVKCSLADISINDDLATVCGLVCRLKVDSMDFEQENQILRLYENPLNQPTSHDVWKLREKIAACNDHRSRRTRIAKDKLGSYEDVSAAKKDDTDDKLKDATITSSCFDEYCKVSAPKSTDDNSNEDISRPLKTNTAFGRSKMPFERFQQQHIGGGIVDCTLRLQPQSMRSPNDECSTPRSRRSGEGAMNSSNSEQRYNDIDETLTCCGAHLDNVIDYCTCMYCVKGLFYHCTKDSCPENELVEPYACTPVGCGCVRRWSALGILAVFLPCLICYPVASGCTEICKCYKRQQASMKEHRERTFQSQNRLR